MEGIRFWLREMSEGISSNYLLKGGGINYNSPVVTYCFREVHRYRSKICAPEEFDAEISPGVGAGGVLSFW